MNEIIFNNGVVEVEELIENIKVYVILVLEYE